MRAYGDIDGDGRNDLLVSATGSARCAANSMISTGGAFYVSQSRIPATNARSILAITCLANAADSVSGSDTALVREPPSGGLSKPDVERPGEERSE